MLTKQCRLCGEVKTIRDFYMERSMADGRRSECKECSKAAVRARAAKSQPAERKAP